MCVTSLVILHGVYHFVHTLDVNNKPSPKPPKNSSQKNKLHNFPKKICKVPNGTLPVRWKIHPPPAKPVVTRLPRQDALLSSVNGDADAVDAIRRTMAAAGIAASWGKKNNGTAGGGWEQRFKNKTCGYVTFFLGGKCSCKHFFLRCLLAQFVLDINSCFVEAVAQTMTLFSGLNLIEQAADWIAGWLL